MARWDEPQTAEELAAKPARRPWHEVLQDFAERTGRPYWRVTTLAERRGNRWS